MPLRISICGIDCGACPAYIATQNNDQEKRVETAAEWSKMFKADIKPNDVNCNGCTFQSGKLFHHCAVCEIRACGMDRGLVNCAHCEDYTCERLDGFFKMAPEAKSNLDRIRKELK